MVKNRFLTGDRRRRFIAPAPTIRRDNTCSLQLRVLRLGLLQNGDVGIGVFPEGEEIQIGSASFRAIALEGIGAGEAETGDQSLFLPELK
jgi:hypothetical protein